uniref:Uncharacterized protein LOC104240063 n=1 Tax=Nicotiana sylvestris TaxID=4096 RepID=A0A1U7XQI3_NICSY|nr:PREDICTED: uncharacterized protein LOC104240063 [Nicotiana sylvestris]
MADEGTSEEHRKKNPKGKWYLDSACSRHVIGDKQLLKMVTKLDGGTITFGDKSKGNVIRVGKVPLSSTCDFDEVYMVDELGYNLFSISQLCDNDYEVRFKKHSWFIEDESGKVILFGNRDRNVYTISNIDNLDNQICLASMIGDPMALCIEESIHVVYVDTNLHSRNENLLEDEEIYIMPKFINTSEITHEEMTDQQDQSTTNFLENQESTTTDPTNSIKKELALVVPNEWKSDPGYPYKYIIGDPQEGLKTRISLKKTSNIVPYPSLNQKRWTRHLGTKDG